MGAGKITLYIATSVDGFIAAEDGSVEWLDEFQSESENGDDESYEEFFDTIDALVMGANTYEQILSFGEWPYGERPTYVLAHDERSRAADAVTFVDDEVQTLTTQLKQRYDHIWMVGGAQVAQAFLRESQIDELRLSLMPVLLGGGIRLFSTNSAKEKLNLVNTVSHGTDIVELHYQTDR